MLEHVELFEDQRAEFRRREIVGLDRLARGTDEVRDRDARDGRRILEGKEEAGLRTFVGREFEQLLSVEGDRAARDRVIRVTGHRERERRFAAAVGPHQRVHAAGLDVEIDALENFIAFDAGFQARDV